jgi:hypothetical protein
MQKYKDPDNKVHEIDEKFEHLLPAGSVKITDEEAIILLTPSPEEIEARKDRQIETELGNDMVRVLMETLVPLINPSLNVTDIINQAKAKRKGEL